MTAVEYRKLTFIAWALATAIMLVSWGPGAWQGTNWQTDDFMRLVQVGDLLAGQAWNDLAQHRLGPPGGTAMHWSRLPDLPIALVTIALAPLLGQQDALAAAAVILPPTYVLLFLLPFAAASRLLLGAARSPAALLIAFTGSLSISQFLPGRVDHHGLQLGMTMIAVAVLLLGLAHRRWRKAIALAGFPLGLSIWIGAETAPVIAAWLAALGLAWCRRGGDLARHGAVASLIAVLVCLMALFSSTPQANWLVAACDTLSPVPIVGMALAAVGFGALHLASGWATQPALRLACAAACGVVVAVAFALSFPDCLAGYGLALDPLVERHWLRHVAEAQPLGALLATAPIKALGFLWTPALGLAYCGFRVVTTRGRARDLWGAIAVILLCPTVLMFGQVRASVFAQLIALLPLAALVTGLWRCLRLERRWLRYAARAVILLSGSAVLWPTIGALAGQPRPDHGGAAARADTRATNPCLNRQAIAPLAEGPPGVILGYIDLGPKLLLATPHAVLAAPYHRDKDGLGATIELFRSSDDDVIRRELRARGVTWIVTCPGIEENTAFRTRTRDGLAERLARGEVPDFLDAVRDPSQPGLHLYRVHL